MTADGGAAAASLGREGGDLRIGAAIAAGHPWLSFICPDCEQIGEIDLRTLEPPSQRDD